MLYLLHLAAFQNREILLVQTGDDPVPIVGYRHIHQHQVYVFLDRLGMVLQLRFGSLDRGIFSIRRLHCVSGPGCDVYVLVLSEGKLLKYEDKQEAQNVKGYWRLIRLKRELVGAARTISAAFRAGHMGPLFQPMVSQLRWT